MKGFVFDIQKIALHDGLGIKQVTKLNRMVISWWAKNKVEFIDLNALLSSNGELIKELSTDGCHLKPDAYIHWSEAVKKILEKYEI